MVNRNQTRKVKGSPASLRVRLPLLRSINDRKVLEAVTSLKNKGYVGIPSLKEIAAEIALLGHEVVPTPGNISNAIASLEEKQYLKRDVAVLAQEGGAQL
jgi:hypothetical protein